MFSVVGASGRVGRVVAEALLAYGAPVRVIVRRADEAEAWRARGAEAAIASAGAPDREALVRALAGARGLFALLPEDPRAADGRAQRRRIAQALADAVKESDVEHVVFLSAMAASLVDGNGPAAELHLAEQVLLATGRRITVLRASTFQENLAPLVEVARAEGIYPSFFPDLDVATPWIATRDVGRSAANHLLSPPPASEVIDLVGPAYSVRQVAAALGTAVGRVVRPSPLAPSEHVHALTSMGLPRPYAESIAELYAALGSGRVRPSGDRTEHGPTTLAETLPALAAGSDPFVAIVHGLEAAWNRHDVVAFAAPYFEDADFVNVFGDWLRGRQAIIDDLRVRHAGPFRHTKMTMRATEVRRLRHDLVLLHSRWRVTGNVTPDGGAAPDRAGLLVHVVEERDGRWAIAATHNTPLPVG
jgi:uncharacterized protein (TIGR02246 family)